MPNATPGAPVLLGPPTGHPPILLERVVGDVDVLGHTVQPRGNPEQVVSHGPAAVPLHRDNFQGTIADDELTPRQLFDGVAQLLHELLVPLDADVADLLRRAPYPPPARPEHGPVAVIGEPRPAR